jgi:hypothetical protein
MVRCGLDARVIDEAFWRWNWDLGLFSEVALSTISGDYGEI